MAGGIEPETWRRNAWLNRLQSLALLGFLLGFLTLLGWILWGRAGLTLLPIAGAVFLWLGSMPPPPMIMRVFGAVELAPARAPFLHNAIRELSDRAGLDVAPTLYYVPNRLINAFSLDGSPRAAIGVTYGFIRSLNAREQVAVLAHEISHLRSNDVRVLNLAGLCTRMTAWLAWVGQLMLLLNVPLLLLGQVTLPWSAILILIVAPTLSALAQLGLSRVREFEADLNAARLTEDPEGLASALVTIDRLQGPWLERMLSPGHPMPAPTLLRTHPPTEERVRRLTTLSRP